MIQRNLLPIAQQLAAEYPVVVITGPRQSGKTTLCRQAFEGLPYRNLEALDTRMHAREDPRGFLAELPSGAVIDEIQNVPELTSYLQVLVDEDKACRPFILTGSHHLGLTQAVSQSLAGRAAILHLLPPSLDELRRFGFKPNRPWDAIWSGAYPRIFDEHLDPARWLASYFETYVQRDVRTITNVGDLSAFTQFVKLVAAHTACELNLSRLGGDAGVSHHTAKSWISILEASYILHRVPAWFENTRKRLVRRPKLHFVDTGLACYLLEIQTPKQLELHPLRGALFESWVASEILKRHLHVGRPGNLLHLRSKDGLEVDLLVKTGGNLQLFESKSGATVMPSHSSALRRAAKQLGETHPRASLGLRLVHGGEIRRTIKGVDYCPWSALDEIEPQFDV